MDFHVHLTLDATGKELIPLGWKRTEIVLEGEKEQTDIMLTKHYRIGTKNIETVEDILADVRRLDLEDLIRIKIEQDSDFYLPVSEQNYVEIHMLCPPGIYPLIGNWVRSSNPKREDKNGKYYFYNQRIYAGDSVEDVKRHILFELKDLQYTELKIEQVIFDSNREHDRWWA